MKKTSIIRVFYIVISIICFSFPLKAQYKPEISWKVINGISIPVPPQEHPRLYLRSPQAEAIASRLEDQILQPVIANLREQSNQTLQFRIEWDAVNYLATNDEELGRKTIDSALALLKRTELPNVSNAARVTGRMMVTGAIVYDWLYPLLTPTEKSEFIEELIRLARTLECGYPPTKQSSVVGHTGESFIMLDMLSAGIAIYDEYPEMYELAAERFFREFISVRNWFYNGHAYHQGDSYGPLRYSFDTFPLMIYDRMGLDNIYNPEQQYVPYFYIYTTRPDRQRMRGGDTYIHSRYRGNPWHTYVGTLITASYYNDGILLEQFISQGGDNGKDNIFQFLWWNTSLKPEPINTLPLSRYFGTPFGWMVARTGWDKEAIIAEMKVNEYNFNGHQHLDAGAFQIYYKGPLATESGMYEGSHGGYSSPHHRNYLLRTIAHNSLLIYVPDEQFKPDSNFGNDGGQRLPNNRSEPKDLGMMLDPANGYKTGEVLAHGFGPSLQTPAYSYLKGDITQAYSTKVSDVRRSFIFLNLFDKHIPAVLIVFDKVVSRNPSYKKYWLLHSIEQPAVSENEVTITRTEKGESGKLVNTTLLPEMDNLKITPVGGPGKEFWVFGTNYENEQRWSDERSYERAAWRVEISPVTPDTENYFLNVMQIMDNSDNQKLNVQRIDGEKVVGVQVSDRFVFFSKSSEPINEPFSISFADDGNYKFLLTDIAPGTWQVKKDEDLFLPNQVVKKEDGIIWFEGTKGSYTFYMGI